MDKPRQLLVAVCSSLSRLQIRLLNQPWSAEYKTDGRVNRYPHWTVADVQPPSPWLAETTPHMALSGAIQRVALISAHLLAMISAPGEINGLDACVVLQALSSTAWSPLVLRLAAQLGVMLPELPIEATHGAQLTEQDLPPVRPVAD